MRDRSEVGSGSTAARVKILAQASACWAVRSSSGQRGSQRSLHRQAAQDCATGAWQATRARCDCGAS